GGWGGGCRQRQSDDAHALRERSRVEGQRETLQVPRNLEVDPGQALEARRLLRARGGGVEDGQSGGEGGGEGGMAHAVSWRGAGRIRPAPVPAPPRIEISVVDRVPVSAYDPGHP